MELLYPLSLITFTFGAITFTVLALSYWRERKQEHAVAFPVFTAVCAVAFVSNLLLSFFRGSTVLPLAAVLALGLVPPLLLHVVFEEEQPHLARQNVWWSLMRVFYVVAGAAAIATGLDTVEAVPLPFSDSTDALRPLLLMTACVVSLAIGVAAGSGGDPAARRFRSRLRLLLPVLLLASAWALWDANPIIDLAADYLLLTFFCVVLYYRRRVAFFDLLIKRGAFFTLALGALTLWLIAVQRFLDPATPWLTALFITPLWLPAPWVYRYVSNTVDRRLLGRTFASAEAERRFSADVQGALTESDLRDRAAAVLTLIFNAPATVDFTAVADTPPSGISADVASGAIVLPPRANSVPYLSDDRRLVQSLADTLSVMLENVRFRDRHRRQQEREQELHLLASRAELKALRAQINPHFLFNALNSIAGLIHERPEYADETIEKLAEVFRYALRSSDKEWVRLDEEIEFAAAYLHVEQARFGERLAIRIAVDERAAAVQIPAMVIQPLVENAVKHGVSTIAGAGFVAVEARRYSDTLRVEVSDNGPGFSESGSRSGSGSGHGLRNVNDRLRGYYGDSVVLRCARDGGITRVSFELPVGMARSLSCES